MERLYESMLILKSSLTEEAQKEIFQKVIKKIEELQGKIVTSKIWAKDRTLCYPIKSRGADKLKNSKGTYWLITFNLDPEGLSEVKEVIRLEERILRNVILKLDS